MARIKPRPDSPSPAKAAKTAASTGSPAKGASAGHPLARRRAKALVVLLSAGALALAARQVWRQVEPLVVNRERYLLPASAITLNPPPEWVLCDVRSQVIASAGLDRRLSILDKSFLPTIRDAFALHPWIERVDRVEKSYPPAVRIQATYRTPVAAVEIPASPPATGSQLLPVDRFGVNLPAAEVPAIRREYLPRITGVVGPPPVGQRWEDPRIAGAVEIAARLGEVWDSLHLDEIIPSARPEVLGDRRYFVYDLRTQGGTRIVWGASPAEALEGESDFAVKRQRLERCSQEYGPFDSVRSPDVVDVRRGVIVTPRQVKKPAEGAAATTVVKKPEESAPAETVVK
jgi:hypothetical protein